MKSAFYAALALAAVGLGYLTASWLQQDQTDGSEVLPAFELVDLNNQTHRSGDYAGQVLMINFWASWCVPCIEEMPLLNQTYRDYHDQGLMILGPAVDDSAEASRFAADLDVQYPVIAGGAELFELMDALGDSLGALPFTVLVNRDGRIVARHSGQLDAARIDKWLQQHL